MQRVDLEPAYVLHVKPFRETSLIVYTLTENHGVVHLITRGARSKNRGLLQPFSFLQISWSGRGELYSMTKYEYLSAISLTMFKQQMSALYLNELILHLVPVGSPSPDLFELYAKTLKIISEQQQLAPSVRLFEVELLNLLGVPLQLDYDVVTEQAIENDGYYLYEPEQGPRAVQQPVDRWNYVPGYVLKGIKDGDFVNEGNIIRRFLGGMIQYHLNGKQIRCRDILEWM